MKQSSPATYNLIVVNVIFYVATLINETFMVKTFGLWHPAVPYFKFWQPVSYMFMHGGFWHIFFNMYSLWIFGMAVERITGSRRFLILYFLAGLGAAAAQLGVQTFTHSYFPTVGASGSIYGIIVAFAMLFPEAKLTLLFPPITLSAKWMAIIFIGIELFTGVTGTDQGVAHFAHLGGALIGWLLILWWYRRPGRNKRNKYDNHYIHYDY